MHARAQQSFPFRPHSPRTPTPPRPPQGCRPAWPRGAVGRAPPDTMAGGPVARRRPVARPPARSAWGARSAGRWPAFGGRRAECGEGRSPLRRGNEQRTRPACALLMGHRAACCHLAALAALSVARRVRAAMAAAASTPSGRGPRSPGLHQLPAGHVHDQAPRLSKKLRFKQGGFDLDLAYTSRLIAMGYPSTGAWSFYRNPATQVRRSSSATTRPLQGVQPVHGEACRGVLGLRTKQSSSTAASTPTLRR